MAESLPSPPRSRTTTPEAKDISNDPASKLDLLLERYLTLLDEYTNLRDELSKAFSSGFFALAQAQRTSSLGAGRRYGEDFYDERMNAVRTIKTVRHGLLYGKSTKETSACDLQKSQTVSPLELEVVEENGQEDSTFTFETTKPSLQGQPEIRDRDEDDQTKVCDPLKWFGILVPPALRQTQSHFIDAVEESIPKLVSVQLAMNGLETEISRAREELAIINKYGELQGDIKHQLQPAASSGNSSEKGIS